MHKIGTDKENGQRVIKIRYARETHELKAYIYSGIIAC